MADVLSLLAHLAILGWVLRLHARIQRAHASVPMTTGQRVVYVCVWFVALNCAFGIAFDLNQLLPGGKR